MSEDSRMERELSLVEFYDAQFAAQEGVRPPQLFARIYEGCDGLWITPLPKSDADENAWQEEFFGTLQDFRDQVEPSLRFTPVHNSGNISVMSDDLSPEKIGALVKTIVEIEPVGEEMIGVAKKTRRRPKIVGGRRNKKRARSQSLIG